MPICYIFQQCRMPCHGLGMFGWMAFQRYNLRLLHRRWFWMALALGRDTWLKYHQMLVVCSVERNYPQGMGQTLKFPHQKFFNGRRDDFYSLLPKMPPSPECGLSPKVPRFGFWIENLCFRQWFITFTHISSFIFLSNASATFANGMCGVDTAIFRSLLMRNISPFSQIFSLNIRYDQCIWNFVFYHFIFIDGGGY